MTKTSVEIERDRYWEEQHSCPDRRPQVVQVTYGEAWFLEESMANAFADWLRERFASEDVWVDPCDLGRNGYSVQWSIEDAP